MLALLVSLCQTKEGHQADTADYQAKWLLSGWPGPGKARIDAEAAVDQKISSDVEIVKLAEEIGAGLIVIGSRGRGGIKRALMGSVSDSVVRHAHCPVLVVRQERQQRDGLRN